MAMSLSTVEVPYNIFQQASANPDSSPPQELDPVLEPIWAQDSLATHDPLELVFRYYEVIFKAMNGPNRPWDDIHHRSYFLPELKRIEAREFVMTMNGDDPCPINPLAIHRIYVEGNMEFIDETILIDISRTHGVMENDFVGADCSPEEIQIYKELFKELCDIFSWSYEEIPGIDPWIIEHEITTFLDVKPFRQKIHPVNPGKVAAVKLEVKKLIKVGFIYPVQLKKWVLNLVPFNKKKGMIHVCMDFHDMNKSFLKDNFPTPFID
jgi:hypothetical protein